MTDNLTETQKRIAKENGMSPEQVADANAMWGNMFPDSPVKTKPQSRMNLGESDANGDIRALQGVRRHRPQRAKTKARRPGARGEKDNQKKAARDLAAKGVQMLKTPAGGIRNQHGSYINFGNKKGTVDNHFGYPIEITPAMVGKTFLIFCAAEMKSSGAITPDDAQSRNLERVDHVGGVAILHNGRVPIIKQVEEIIELYQSGEKVDRVLVKRKGWVNKE